jgi:CheY-like chemotaxis protein
MGARILVADDSVTIQKVVELTFSKEDFSLVQARNGDEAIRKAKEARPDVILLDLVMPDKNGYDVCAALRTEPSLKGVPIILLAGTFESYDQDRAKRAGANDFITKPFESQALIGKVKQALFARSMDASSPPAGQSPALVLDEDTLKIPPAAVPGRAGEAAPPKAQAIPALSQDDLWQLLEAPGAAPAAPSAPAPPPAELSLEELTPAPAPPVSEISELDLGALETPTPAAPGGAVPDTGLSLDDLLSPPSAPQPKAAEPSGGSSVIELSVDEGLSPLPMVEAGKGEPAAFSIDDLLAAPDVKPVPVPETAGLEIPALDLGGLQEAAAPVPPVEEPPAGGAQEFSLEEFGIQEAAAAQELTAVLGAPEALEPAEEIPTAAPSAPEQAGVRGVEAAVGGPIDLGPSDVDEITRTVTKRVAEELAVELRNSLIERIEKIVWEVVPDLAEILITKEIERIRRQADEDKTA